MRLWNWKKSKKAQKRNSMTLSIQEHVPLAPFTTFQIGGTARYFVEVRNEAELREALAWSSENGTGFLLLAGASNVLVPDEGLNLLVIRIVEGEYTLTGGTLMADAGCNLLSLIRAASAQGMGGWEKLSGIPGTIGGAVRGNAGAFGTEIKDFVTSVEAINARSLERVVLSNEACRFSYRNSFIKSHPELIVTKVTLQLRDADAVTTKKAIEETIAEREKRHLQNVKAAGSYFMNPVAPAQVVALFESEKGVKSRENRVPAGWLIEKAGLKGATVGGAQASMQHPNYIVNTGTATSKNVRELAEVIKQKVRAEFGVELQEEASLL
jgi:UDP-N-acetylmuramate dehydrogenase